MSALPRDADPASDENASKHLHVRLSHSGSAIYDLITEYLEAAGKAPDWYWRSAGRLEGDDAEHLEELLSSAFEAGAFTAHEHPEDLVFRWVDEKECERERKAEMRGSDRDETKQERSSLSHYA